MDTVAALLEAGRFEEARRLATDLVASDQSDWEGLCLLTVAHLRCGDARLAFDCALAAMRADPQQEWPYRLVARAYLGNNQIQEAVLAARQATLLAPGSWQAWMTLAEAASQLQPPTQEGLDAAGEAVRLAPAIADVHFAVGLAAHRLGQGALAGQGYTEALRRDPAHAPSMHNLALLQASGGIDLEALRAGTGQIGPMPGQVPPAAPTVAAPAAPTVAGPAAAQAPTVAAPVMPGVVQAGARPAAGQNRAPGRGPANADTTRRVNVYLRTVEQVLAGGALVGTVARAFDPAQDRILGLVVAVGIVMVPMAGLTSSRVPAGVRSAIMARLSADAPLRGRLSLFGWGAITGVITLFVPDPGIQRILVGLTAVLLFGGIVLGLATWGKSPSARK